MNTTKFEAHAQSQLVALASAQPYSHISFDFSERTSFYDLKPHFVIDELLVPKGEILELNSIIGDTQALPFDLKSTQRLETFRSWVGMGDCSWSPNASLRTPSKSWSGRKVNSIADLTSQEAEDVGAAAAAYLFGDALVAKGYEEVIEQVYGPFRAAIFAVKTIRIETASQLIIKGYPTVLIAEKIELVDGGNLVALDTPFKADIGTLRKIDGPSNAIN